MKVSVIVPVYNTEEYLPKCLESLLNQTEKDIEIICVNDSSTDGSLSILKKYAKRDKRLKYFTVPNGGAGAARNRGLEKATGEFIYFFDSDDVAEEHLLEKALKRAEETSADIVAFHGYQFEDGKKESAKFKAGFNQKLLKQYLEAGTFSYKDFNNSIMSVVNVVPWNKLYRAEFIKGLPFGFDEISSTNDISFSALSVAAAREIAVIDESLVYYRVSRKDSITSKKETKLYNVVTAVNSVVKGAKEFRYYSEIKYAVLRFVICNYRFAYKNYCTEFEAEGVREFYNKVREVFNGKEFASVSPKDVEMEADSPNYRFFINTKKYTYEETREIRSRELIFSLTSYPKRIATVYKVIDNLCNQTKKADRIMLWLAEDEFKNGDSDLPQELRERKEEGKVEIHYCENLLPHKKYYYAMKENPKSVVITFDDDLVYSPHTAQWLWESYLNFPECVSAMRTHVIAVDIQKEEIMPYEYWLKACNVKIMQSMQLFSTNGAGALYPPGIINERAFDKDKFMEICPMADDLWLNAMCVINNVPTVSIGREEPLRYISGTQGGSLYSANKKSGSGLNNDSQLEAIHSWLVSEYGYDVLYKNIVSGDLQHFLTVKEILSLTQQVNEKYINEKKKSAGQKREIRKLNGKIDSEKQKGTGNKGLRKLLKRVYRRLFG